MEKKFVIVSKRMRENTFTRRNHWKQPPRHFMKMVLKGLEEGVLTIEKLQFY